MEGEKWEETPEPPIYKQYRTGPVRLNQTGSASLKPNPFLLIFTPLLTAYTP